MFITDTLGFIMMGALFGFTAGISPGPLLTLVISETIKHNRSAGLKVAIAPLITDLPIIIIAFFIFSRLSQFNIFISLISLFGGMFLIYLGFECLKTKRLGADIQNVKPESLLKGIAVNILNPHPYLFWITVGTPLALKAYHTSLSTVILFFLSFYFLLIGSKIVIALLVDRSRTFLNDRIYIWIMRILGLSLFIFAVLLFFDSIKSLQSLIQ